MMEVKEFIKRLSEKLKHHWNLYDEAVRNSAVETIEFELGEMENIFALLVLGSFVGLPSPPMQITLDLLPEMEEYLTLMLNKTDMANEPLSNLFSVFEVI